MRLQLDNNITITEWADTVYQFELDRSTKKLVAGYDPELVLIEMSLRIQKKMLHFIINKKKSTIGKFDIVESALRYKLAYTDKHGPKADQVQE